MRDFEILNFSKKIVIVRFVLIEKENLFFLLCLAKTKE